MRRRQFLTMAAGLAARAVTAGCFGTTFLAPPVLHARQDFPAPRQETYRVINTYPHDPKAFTQGLFFHEGRLYESTGGWGSSSLRKVELETGRVLRIHHLPARYFGEGLALWQNRLIQVTWKSGTGFVYDLETFEQLETFSYPGEGWGLTQDDQGLILSDGSNILRRLDPTTFQETGRIAVHYEGRPMRGLNELEYIEGEVWAKVFPTEDMVRIDPQTGHVLSRVVLTGILGPRRLPHDAVPNGIAYDAATQRIFVTGKLWPVLFEIRVIPR
ncbi:Glutamine cyclotransferase [Desulfonatronum thiosulfatophilum]|uniref:Glutamine cyclotransferase n=1 Tax=Desulfonatronum thiosulfatophilum TaxID=617002 RepID=A0A1G6BCT5_9BACT|nr:glutaminyl-peptide cyclotransferase [Desulfonatronum thiosulfatophilum]SDB18440.1 Glutamine cyclotransferase [Desulfonatronum thiosulfatophilum]